MVNMRVDAPWAVTASRDAMQQSHLTSAALLWSSAPRRLPLLYRSVPPNMNPRAGPRTAPVVGRDRLAKTCDTKLCASTAGGVAGPNPLLTSAF
jgi:hypothetical protein